MQQEKEVDCLLVADSCLINAIKENNKTATGWVSRRCGRQGGFEDEEGGRGRTTGQPALGEMPGTSKGIRKRGR